MQTVAIAGVGLIGGSFGLALRAAGFTGRILGVSSPATIRTAVGRKAIDEGATLEEAAGCADVILLAQPIRVILDTLGRIDDLVRPGTLITDAGSTKGCIVHRANERIRRGVFLGGHPMAGKERSGIAEAESGLFTGRTWALCPFDPGMLERDPAAGFVRWIERIGARPAVLEAGEHDRLAAFTSHLPQLISTVLAETVAGRPRATELAGPALRDLTRLASSPYSIWRDILSTNRDAIQDAVGQFVAELQRVTTNMEGRDVESAFDRAQASAQILRSRE